MISNQKAEAAHSGRYMYLPSVVVISLILGLDSSSCHLQLTEGAAFSTAECFLAAAPLISNQKLLIFLFSLSRSAYCVLKRFFSCT